jgi:hypothetical protein
MQSNAQREGWGQPDGAFGHEELSEEWWQACYVPGNCDDALQAPTRSVAVCAPAGGGKTTALLATQRSLAETALAAVIDAKLLVRPPEDEDRDLLNPMHLLMRAACGALQRKIAADPAALAGLSGLQRQFLSWALHKYLRRRTLDVWLDRLHQREVSALFATPDEDLYGDERDADYVTGQIDELVHLAAGLGSEAVVMLLDVQQTPAHGGWRLLEDMFGWLELWQNPSFMLKAVLPPAVAEQGRLHERARGRVVFRALAWSVEQHEAIIAQRLSYWSGVAVELGDVLTPANWAQVSAALDDIFGGSTPRSAVSLAEAIRDLWPARHWPLQQGEEERVRRELYRRHALLRLDKQQRGVWRGERFIGLADQPYEALRALWEAGEGDTLAALRDVAGSDGNMHTLVKRLRQAIEPFPGAPLYICRESGEAYRLEGVAKRY